MVPLNQELSINSPTALGAASIKRELRIIELRCPDEIDLARFPAYPALFIAGGIGVGTNSVPDWQNLLIHQLLADLEIIAINPRRENFPAGDPNALRAQVAWEYRGLHAAQAISFWLPANYPCPITLYELGTWSMRAKPIFVGIDPGYPHRDSLIAQLAIARPNLRVVDTLERLADDIRRWRNGEGRIDLPDPRPAFAPKRVFLGGGIAGCPDWQSEISALIDGTALLIDPRDRSLDRYALTPPQLRALSADNHKKLLECEGFCIWFPEECKSPTSLFELGAVASMVERPLFVGAHPNYFRASDVKLQIGLTRPEVKVTGSLEMLAEQVKQYYRMR